MVSCYINSAVMMGEVNVDISVAAREREEGCYSQIGR